ncbi:MAG: hypothetical protein ABW185_20960 [Sedimenticola sp.]
MIWRAPTAAEVRSDSNSAVSSSTKAPFEAPRHRSMCDAIATICRTLASVLSQTFATE